MCWCCRRKKHVKVIILGPQGAGKSALIKVINKQGLENLRPTQGHEVTQIETEDVVFDLWELSGELDFQEIWEIYYEVKTPSF